MGDWIDRTPPANDMPIERSWEQMSTHDKYMALLVLLFIVVAFLLRNTPLGFLWKGVCGFFIVLAATILADHAKNNIKEWWNKK